MRHANLKLKEVKVVFTVRLSYILVELGNHYSNMEMAEKCGVSANSISKIRNKHSDLVSLDIVLKVAKKLNLNYSFSIIGKNGKETYEVDVESALDYMKRNHPGLYPAMPQRIAKHRVRTTYQYLN